MLSALLCLEAARALRSKSKGPEESWSTDPAVEIAPGFASSGWFQLILHNGATGGKITVVGMTKKVD